MNRKKLAKMNLVSKSLIITLPLLLFVITTTSFIKINSTLILGIFLNPFSYLLFSITLLSFLIAQTATLLEELKKSWRIAVYNNKVVITKNTVKSIFFLLFFTMFSATTSLLELFSTQNVENNLALYAGVLTLVAISNLLAVIFFIVLTYYVSKYRKDDIKAFMVGCELEFSLIVEEYDLVDTTISLAYTEKQFNTLISTYLLKNKDVFIINNLKKADFLNDLKKGTMPPNNLVIG